MTTTAALVVAEAANRGALVQQLAVAIHHANCPCNDDCLEDDMISAEAALALLESEGRLSPLMHGFGAPIPARRYWHERAGVAALEQHAAEVELERMRGLLAQACNEIDDLTDTGGPSAVAAALRTRGGRRRSPTRGREDR